MFFDFMCGIDMGEDWNFEFCLVRVVQYGVVLVVFVDDEFDWLVCDGFDFFVQCFGQDIGCVVIDYDDVVICDDEVEIVVVVGVFVGWWCCCFNGRLDVWDDFYWFGIKSGVWILVCNIFIGECWIGKVDG